jgi:hypothetical protein
MVAPAHEADGWLLHIVVECEVGPWISKGEMVSVAAQQIDLNLRRMTPAVGPQHYPCSPMSNMLTPRPSQPKQHSRDGEVALTNGSDQIRLRGNLQQAHSRLSAGRLTSNRSDRRGTSFKKRVG